MNVCDHAGFHSGQGRYTAETAELRYVLVCEDCDSELRVLESVEYRRAAARARAAGQLSVAHPRPTAGAPKQNMLRTS